jgi:hypothetical protein
MNKTVLLSCTAASNAELIPKSCLVKRETRNGLRVSVTSSNLSYDRRSVGQSVLVSGHHQGPVTNFSLKFPLDSCGIIMEHPL